jgi:hypothetical protein
MLKLPLLRRIGNAAAVLFGSHGAVAQAARQAGCSRQTVYDHAHQVQQALQEAQLPGPSRQDLLSQLEQLHQDNASLRQQLAQRGEFIEFNEQRRQRLCGTATAMGLSLNQIAEVFAVLLADQPPSVACKPAPSRATLGRWVLAACLLAGAVLRLLDQRSRGLARVLCLDEIFFHGKPVLVAVEPSSMAVLHCHKAPDRTGQTSKNCQISRLRHETMPGRRRLIQGMPNLTLGSRVPGDCHLGVNGERAGPARPCAQTARTYALARICQVARCPNRPP